MAATLPTLQLRAAASGVETLDNRGRLPICGAVNLDRSLAGKQSLYRIKFVPKRGSAPG